ncbi:recombinase family protein [Streptomyces sp. NPDC020125]|uniref:recombinase family protein n=1 Tax=Streptomyces sp. NPDC020125 TaxID=3154593 RepID=UPI0033E73B4B
MTTHDEPRTLVFIYDREETTQTDRLNTRIALCRAFAAQMNWEVVGQWVDRGDAAVSERRPFWQGMIAAMRHEGRGRRFVCLVASWERIAYDPVTSDRLRQLVSNIDGVCVAVNDTAREVQPRLEPAAIRGVDANGKPRTCRSRRPGSSARDGMR